MIGSPGHSQIAASFRIIVPRIGYPGNPEALPQVFDGRPSMPKSCRAPKHVAFAIIKTHTLFAQGWSIMEIKAIASLNLLAIMFSGLDQREEAFAAATVSCMRPELDFGATIMLPRITIGDSNPLAAGMAVSLTDLCGRRSCFFSRDRFLIKYRRIFSRREFSPSIRKDAKLTIPVRPWFTGSAAAKAKRMNDEAHTTLSRADEPGDQRKILDAAGGEA